VQQLGHFEKYIRNTVPGKVLKGGGGGEGRRRSVGPRNKYYIESRRAIQYNIKKDNWTGHILGRNRLLQRVTEGKIQGRSDGKMRKKT
jgi:hypothetical protein